MALFPTFRRSENGGLSRTPRQKRSAGRFLPGLAWASLGLLFAGCANLGYYAQAVQGHLDLLGRRQEIQALIADPATPAERRERLELVLELRAFASRELGLPDNPSYRSYVELERPAVVWSLVAAPQFSLQPHQWCYPVIGCASYRGYFRRLAAEREAEALAAEGLDVTLEPVPAYSTLGWFDDPLPSTVIDWNEPELAGLIFHELAHQRLYFPGDSGFNEAFASLVEQVGVERWLAARGDPQALARQRLMRERRSAFVDLLLASRGRLQALYAGDLAPEPMRARKAEEFARLRREYRALRRAWGGYAGFDTWFARAPLNNARLASLATYQALIPALEALLADQGGDLEVFYQACGELKQLDPAQRRRALGVGSAARRPGNKVKAVAAATDSVAAGLVRRGIEAPRRRYPAG
jgi:predicted aminopeptidase